MLFRSKGPAAAWMPDIARAAVGGAASGAVLWMFVALFVAAMLAKSDRQNIQRSWGAIWCGETLVPWRAVLMTLCAVFVAGGAVAALAFAVSASSPRVASQRRIRR